MEKYEKAVIKLIEAINILHQRGYELIRVFPSVAPSGCYWRCFISTKDNFDKTYGIKPEPIINKEGVYYSTGALYEYFENFKGKRASLDNIADELLKRFPFLETKGKGQDPDYMLWFQKFLSNVKSGNLPYVMDDYFDGIKEGYLETGDEKLELPKY